MTDTADSRLLIPALAPVYRALAPWTELLIRLVAGLSFVPHGLPKLMNPVGAAQFFEQSGFRPAILWAIIVGMTEVFGGLFLAAGLLTRAVCIPILIFLVTAIVTYNWQFGFLWNNRGIEYPLFWAIVVLHFLVHGGGRCSIDARIGREF
jgi:putative oxidoreductase